MITSLAHVALSVSDMERSLAFYRDFIGMKVVLDLDASDGRIGRVNGLPGSNCRIVHLALGSGILELFSYIMPAGEAPAEEAARRMRQCDHGLIHIGFEVTDFPRHLEELRKMKVEFLGEAMEFRPGVWLVYFRGPDGEVCEMRERREGVV